MGRWGGNMSGSRRRAWSAEFDARKKAGAPTRRMSGGEKQIQDDKGNWFRRNGDACCGCGKHAQAKAPDPDDPSVGLDDNSRATPKTRRGGKW